MAHGSGGLDVASILKYGLLAGGGYFLYQAYQKAAAAGPVTFQTLLSALTGSGPSIDVKILSADKQQQFITAARARGLTDAQIQAKFDELVPLFAACKAPYTWAPEGVCVGTLPVGSVPTGPPPTSPAPSGGSPPVVVGPPVTVGTDLVSQLKAAAAGDPNFTGGMGDADHWNYYRNRLRPPDLSSNDFIRAFCSSPACADRSTLRTAETFVAQLQSAGLAGLGDVRRLKVPMVVQHRGRRALVWVMR